MFSGKVKISVYDETDIKNLNNSTLSYESEYSNTTQNSYIDKITDALVDINYDFYGTSSKADIVSLNQPAIRTTEGSLLSVNLGGSSANNSIDMNTNQAGSAVTQIGSDSVYGHAVFLRGENVSNASVWGYASMQYADTTSLSGASSNKRQYEWVIGGVACKWTHANLVHADYFDVTADGNQGFYKNLTHIASKSSINQTVTIFQTLKLTWTLQYGPDQSN